MKSTALILQAWRDPVCVGAFTLGQWDLLLRQARQANLLASLHARLDALGLLDKVPAQARQHLQWAHVVGQRHRQAVRWEVRLIRQALARTGVPVILLKGAAYAVADLPPAAGRLFSDVDILVPPQHLNAVEAALMLHGWAATHHDAYDQRYYREWMHELPPLQHSKRTTVIDVHHAILPKTARLQPDPQLLRAAAVNINDDAMLQMLAPVDMLLHSATHLFHNEQLDQGLRDLADMDRLLRHFADTPDFWTTLVPRAQALQLTRPLFYALRYATQLLHTPIPAHTMQAAQCGRPNALLLACMDQLYRRALMPLHASCTDWLSASARQLLYVRANWLRMPPLMLTRHLLHKALLSPKAE